MKKSLFLLASPLFLLASCGGNSVSINKTITIAASELPHAKILNEAFKPILAKEGYELEVKVLDWTIQNEAVAKGEYDANYFQHVPYLADQVEKGDLDLYPLCKVHYEKLCLYKSDKGSSKVNSDGSIQNGSSIEIVDDVTNVERALELLKAEGLLTINDSVYTDGVFDSAKFSTTNPESCITWADGYKDCDLTCIVESQLAVSLADYDFGVLPGNTALTGLGDDYASRIVFSENASLEQISAKANVIVVNQVTDLGKCSALLRAAASPAVASYIATTFGESVIYHFEDGLAGNFLG